MDELPSQLELALHRMQLRDGAKDHRLGLSIALDLVHQLLASRECLRYVCRP